MEIVRQSDPLLPPLSTHTNTFKSNNIFNYCNFNLSQEKCRTYPGNISDTSLISKHKRFRTLFLITKILTDAELISNRDSFDSQEHPSREIMSFPLGRPIIKYSSRKIAPARRAGAAAARGPFLHSDALTHGVHSRLLLPPGCIAN